MLNFKETDIETLDFIVDKCLNTNWVVRKSDLIENKLISTTDERGYDKDLGTGIISNDEFKSLLHILEYFEICECGFKDQQLFARSNSKTANFKRQGGFRNLYNELIDNEKDKLNIRNKNKFQSKLAKWQVKTFWPVFIFGFFGFIFGMHNFIKDLSKSKQIIELKENQEHIQKELFTLQTLILDQKHTSSIRNLPPLKEVNKDKE